ncbi:fibroblast growth factor 4A-like [Scyliorhinus torazame]|uniref:fibroblast growth factor 4A-like n=1 Tax=Scyliorhinus torazame TaxID=75743 RepID=UPI003B5B457A
MSRGVRRTPTQKFFNSLTAMLMLAKVQEMCSGAVTRNKAGAELGPTWRDVRQKYKVKWSELHPTLAAPLLDWRGWRLERLWGNKRSKEQLLYCRVGIGFHLQVLPNGTVNGAHQSSKYGVMQLFSVKIGIVAIRAVVTRLFLAITSKGILYGSETFTADCLFKEQMEENHYTTYSSHIHPQLYVALTKRGGAKNGNKARLHHPSTHFIPRFVKGS